MSSPVNPLLGMLSKLFGQCSPEQRAQVIALMSGTVPQITLPGVTIPVLRSKTFLLAATTTGQLVAPVGTSTIYVLAYAISGVTAGNLTDIRFVSVPSGDNVVSAAQVADNTRWAVYQATQQITGSTGSDGIYEALATVYPSYLFKTDAGAGLSFITSLLLSGWVAITYWISEK